MFAILIRNDTRWIAFVDEVCEKRYDYETCPIPRMYLLARNRESAQRRKFRNERFISHERIARIGEGAIDLVF